MSDIFIAKMPAVANRAAVTLAGGVQLMIALLSSMNVEAVRSCARFCKQEQLDEISKARED
jgi:hypothetical protein